MRIVRALRWILLSVAVSIPLLAITIPPNLIVQFFVSLLALWSLSYSIESTCDELGTTRFVTIFVVPYLTTLPELISTYYLVATGHILAGALTFAGSAVFDLFLVLPILARGTELDKTFLIFSIVSLILPIYAFTVGGIVKSRLLGILLILVGTVVTLTVATYGTHRIINPQTSSTAELIATVITLMSSIVAFTYTCIAYSSIVTALSNYIPETVAGILNAYMTSIPDAIYAEASREAGKLDEAIGELWSCVIHDYTIVPGFALALGGALALSLRDIMYLVAIPAIFTIVMTATRMYINKKTLTALIVLFILFTLGAVFL